MASLYLPSLHPSPLTFQTSHLYSSPGVVHLPNSYFRSTCLRVSHCYRPLATQSPHIPLSSQTLKNPAYSSSSPSSTPTTLIFRKPFKSTNINHLLLPQRPKSTQSISNQRKKTICKSSNQTMVPVKERLISAVSYCIPFFNGLNYGIFLFNKYPFLESAFDPIVPILSFYKSIPGVGMAAFLALFVGVVRDKSFSRYVRFNALQATMLDVLLVLPSFVHIVLETQQEGLKFQLLEMGYSATFVVIVFSFLYAMGLSVIGRIPYFPLVTEAVDWQIFAVDRQL